MRRKVAKRTLPFDITMEELHLIKKRRLEKLSLEKTLPTEKVLKRLLYRMFRNVLLLLLLMVILMM